MEGIEERRLTPNCVRVQVSLRKHSRWRVSICRTTIISPAAPLSVSVRRSAFDYYGRTDDRIYRPWAARALGLDLISPWATSRCTCAALSFVPDYQLLTPPVESIFLSAHTQTRHIAQAGRVSMDRGDGVPHPEGNATSSTSSTRVSLERSVENERSRSSSPSVASSGEDSAARSAKKLRIDLAPDQPLTADGKPRARVYVACQGW